MIKLRVAKINEDEPKIKKRSGGRFKSIIDIEDYDPGLMANYADKIKIKKNKKVKIKGKITKDNLISKPENVPPVIKTII